MRLGSADGLMQATPGNRRNTESDDDPEFQAMVEEIEADMAAQLARVREMERNGELEPIPEISATTQ